MIRIPEYRQTTDALALAAHVGVGEKGLQGGPESGILSTSESACKASTPKKSPVEITLAGLTFLHPQKSGVKSFFFSAPLARYFVDLLQHVASRLWPCDVHSGLEMSVEESHSSPELSPHELRLGRCDSGRDCGVARSLIVLPPPFLLAP